ncbi:sperm acrosome membrane-associated protein 4-like [Parambassis ranga]|uniref:Sperm acrosome membrane-associated protein 4-like n=1 Tax=Parambassis ranga TaxID=210632 RepID=A0A6P7K0I9_9TELE|nr:sperm acrosome membrane-associated protein 4-like [Parambassis ranga]
MESVGFEEQEEYLQCFRCDLGFWDACYTTETNCSLGERCYTGRGKAADSLDVKTLGCVKAEECGVETTVELFSNQTIFVMTKHCCDTSFCNSAHKLPIYTFWYIAAVFLTTWHVTEDSAGS